MKKIFATSLVFLIPLSSFAFLQNSDFSLNEPAGFFWGVWHGLLAPYTLLVRWFIDGIQMYTVFNNGWFYDLGFLIGASGSLPLGWLAAIFSIVYIVFF